MPKELSEISGISFINDSILVAISDGKPFLYCYNFYTEEIVNQIKITAAAANVPVSVLLIPPFYGYAITKELKEIKCLKVWPKQVKPP